MWLRGQKWEVGTPHWAATQVQISAAKAGTYGIERDVARQALVAAYQAGQHELNGIAIEFHLKRADAYFKGYLGWTDSTKTRRPNDWMKAK